MMGWAALALIAGLTAIALFLMRVPRALGSFVGAAMLLGATGYALTGSPGQPDAPVSARDKRQDINPDMIRLRNDMFGQFTFASQYLGASDAMISSGNTAFGVQVLLSGLRKGPKDASLWTALGMAYQAHDGGRLSPAAQYAFDKAEAVAPQHPGPRFFHGMALIRAGDLKAAQTEWRAALKLAPPKSQIEQDISERLAMLDQLLRQIDAEKAAAPSSPTSPPQ